METQENDLSNFRSDYPEAETAKAAVCYMKQHSLSYKAIADGDVIVLEGPNTRCIRRQRQNLDENIA